MNCPYCSYKDNQVIDTRLSTYNQIDGIRRRRQCLNPDCTKRFSSFEMTIKDLQGVEPATLDGILQQIIKVFKGVPVTHYKALPDTLIEEKVNVSNGSSKPLAKPETLQKPSNNPTPPLPKRDLKREMQEAMRRARIEYAETLDELDASEFDDADFD